MLIFVNQDNISWKWNNNNVFISSNNQIKIQFEM